MTVPVSRSWPALDVRTADPSRQEVALAVLDDFGPTAIDDADGAVLRAFFTSTDDRDAAALALSPQFLTLSVDVPDEGWAERSQASLRAVHVGHLIVAPPWDIPDGSDRSRTIVIRPSMGFGTGHHATTRLCLRAMQTLSFDLASVVDVGTGSGVLAIAAARLGAAQVLAIDADPDATACAVENVETNGVADRVSVVTADSRDVADRGFDVLLANLTGPSLRASSERLLRMVHAGGHLILSGFTLPEEDAVAGAFAPPARMALRDQEDEWGLLVLRLPAQA